MDALFWSIVLDTAVAVQFAFFLDTALHWLE